MKEYIKKYQYLDIKTRKNISAHFLGNFKSAFKGNGLVFSEFKTREDGEDATHIDWLVSAREGKLLSRRMEEERELSVMFFLDISSTMNFGFQKTKKDILLELFFLLGFSALEDGDRVGAFLYGGNEVAFTPSSKNRASIFNLYSKISEYKNTKNIAQLGDTIDLFESLKLKKNLIFIFTDTMDIERKKLGALCLQNEVIFVNIFHSFENTLELEDAGNIPINGLEGGFLSIDLQDADKKKQFQVMRQEKIEHFAQFVRSSGGDYLCIDEKKDIFKMFFAFMKQRENRR